MGHQQHTGNWKDGIEGIKMKQAVEACHCLRTMLVLEWSDAKPIEKSSNSKGNIMHGGSAS